MKRRLPAGARVLLAALGILVGTAGAGHAACHSSCTEELRACGRTCTGLHGKARRQCRRRCGERSTCTAPGAPIRTLAYVVSECTTDPEQRSSLAQKLVVRRGNCDPVTVMEARTPTPVFDPSGVCRQIGTDRLSFEFVSTPDQLAVGVFQALVVLPDGSGAVFNVSKQFPPVLPGLTPEPPDEGIFFVRADGSGLQRLGPPSRVQSPAGSFRWAASPDGRRIAFVDLGIGDAGDEAQQVWLLDLPACLRDRQSRCRRQLTRQSRKSTRDDPGVSFPIFVDSRNVGFYTGSTGGGTFTAWQVRTNGTHRRKAFEVTDGAPHVIPTFGVTGKHPTAILVLFPEIPAVDAYPYLHFAREVFAVRGKNVLQLTAFNRSDTAPGGGAGRGVLVGDRLLFVATVNLGENPDQICQLFSTSTLGGDIRQVTHLRSDGRSPSLGCRYSPPGCGIFSVSTAADRDTGTVLFSSTCDPLGGNPFGDQVFAMRPDGSQPPRQLTNARGMTTGPDGTLHVELAGPFASP